MIDDDDDDDDGRKDGFISNISGDRTQKDEKTLRNSQHKEEKLFTRIKSDDNKTQVKEKM